MIRHFDFIAQKHFYIIWLSNLSILSIPDEGYFRNVSKYDIYVFTSDHLSYMYMYVTLFQCTIGRSHTSPIT